MDPGPYILPVLGLLMLATLVFMTAAWVFDGTKPEEDVDFFDEEPPPEEPKPPPRRGSRR